MEMPTPTDNNETKVSEPIGEVVNGYADEQLYSIDNWPGMPLVGPTCREEAHARIDEAEREIAEGNTMRWSDFKSLLRNRHSTSYAV